MTNTRQTDHVAAAASATNQEGKESLTITPNDVGTISAAELTSPKTATQVHRSLKQPVADTSNMSRDELIAELSRLQAQRGPSRSATKTIRFNDGKEPNLYAAGDKMLDSFGKATGKIAKGGEVKSARDSGTISVYGFGRNPMSMFAGQLLEFLAFGPDIAVYIRDNADWIDEYVAGKVGNTSRNINRELLDQVLEQFNLNTTSAAGA